LGLFFYVIFGCCKKCNNCPLLRLVGYLLTINSIYDIIDIVPKKFEMEKIVFFLLLEVINWSIMPYEIFVLKFSFRQSLVCRLLTVVTDVIFLFYFLQIDVIWTSQSSYEGFEHIFAGIKMAPASVLFLFVKLLFVNQVIIRLLQKVKINISLITWKKIGLSIISSVALNLIAGTIYSIFRVELLDCLKQLIAIF